MKSPITREQAVTAYLNGDKVECGTPCNGHMATWFPVECYTDFDVHKLFRLVPKPLECWVAEYENGYRQAYFTRPGSITESVDCRLVRVVHMREVTE